MFVLFIITFNLVKTTVLNLLVVLSFIVTYVSYGIDLSNCIIITVLNYYTVNHKKT